MKRQAPKQVRELIAVALIFAVPLAGSVFGFGPSLPQAGAAFVKFTAASAMPDVGVEIFLDDVRAYVEEHSGPAGPQPEIYVPPTGEEPETPEATPAPQREPEPLDDLRSDLEKAMAAIPEGNRKPIEQVQFLSHPSGDNFFNYENGTVRNATTYSNSEMLNYAMGDLLFGIELNSTEPQVLVMHTHSTESYDRFDAGFYDVNYPTRSTDIEDNINVVGKQIVDTLNSLGICAIQATDYHDYPSYNNSYSRSAVTVQRELARHPSIKIVLDIHRDGIQAENGTRTKPTAMIDGKKAAQIMIVSGADDGTMNLPNFRENLKLAVRLQNSAESLFPGLTRPVLLAYRHYNQDLTTGSLLIEVGSESNTLEEARYAGELVGRALANLFGAPVT